MAGSLEKSMPVLKLYMEKHLLMKQPALILHPNPHLAKEKQPNIIHLQLQFDTHPQIKTV